MLRLVSLVGIISLFLLFQFAEAAKLKPLELQLKKLEDISEAIVQDFAYMREREEQMRDTNGERMLVKYRACSA